MSRRPRCDHPDRIGNDRNGSRQRAARRGALFAGTLGAILAGFTPGLAQDLVVQGCNERLFGEVGVAVLSGNVGQTIPVPITVHATSPIDAFTLTVDLPPDVLELVGTEDGDLIAPSSWWLAGHHFPETSQVRIVGVMDPRRAAPIPPGAIGSLAVLLFRVTAAGAGEFGTSSLLDDLSGYVSCEDVHGTSAVGPSGWGRVKAAYR